MVRTLYKRVVQEEWIVKAAYAPHGLAGIVFRPKKFENKWYLTDKIGQIRHLFKL